MIKVGDKFMEENTYTHIVKVLKKNEVITHCVEVGCNCTWSYENLYHELYLQQKQRADAADAKWEKLKQMLSEKELNLKQSRSLNPFCEGELLGTQVSLYLMKILERGEE